MRLRLILELLLQFLELEYLLFLNINLFFDQMLIKKLVRI